MRRQTAMWALVLSYAAMMALAIAVNLMPVFLTTLSVDLGGQTGLSKEQLGRVGAMTFFGLVIGIFITGPLADRLGAKPFAILGNAFIAGGLLLAWAAQSYTVLLASCVAMGIGAGVLDMILSPVVCVLQPERRTAAMNLLHSFYCTGAVVTVLIATWALHGGVAWRSICLGMVAMPAAVTLGFLALPPLPLVHEDQQRQSSRSLLRDRYFQVCLLAIFLGGATELGMAQWLPAYAELALGYSAWVGGMALLAFSVAMAVGRLAAGAIGHRVSAITLMLTLCAGAVAAFVLACFSPWPALALAGCVLAGLTGSALWPSMLGVTADRYPHGGATMFALLAGMGNLGGIVMPWIVGAIADLGMREPGASANWPMRWGLATATLCPLLMIALLLWLRRHAAPAPGPGR
jgi:MFS family permease